MISALRSESRLYNVPRLKEAFDSASDAKNDMIERLLHHAETRSGIKALWHDYHKAMSFGAWQTAHTMNDFSLFAPKLERIIEAVRGIGRYKQELLGLESPYEARLDRLTPGLRLTDMEQYKADILAHKDKLRAVTIHDRYDEVQSGWLGDVDRDTQLEIVKDVLWGMGLNHANCNLLFEEDTYPLCFLFDEKVELTLQYNRDEPVQTVLDAVHEAGHAMLRVHMPEQAGHSFLGLIDEYYNAPDEAIALMFEQYVLRSPEFAEYLHGLFAKRLPEKEIDPELMVARLRYSSGGLNRYRAAPARRVMTLLQYYDIEKALIDDEVNVEDMPDMWKNSALEYHGFHVGDDPRQNILQDPHWATGEVGRFSAGYFLGTLIAAQLFETMQREAPDAMEGVGRGDFSSVIDWMKDYVFKHPRQEHYQKFVKRATGRNLDTGAFLRCALKRNYPEFEYATDIAANPQNHDLKL